MNEILCFGDSNTYGLIPGTSERYSRDLRWTGILNKELQNIGLTVIEEGLCGRTTVFEDELRDGRRGDMLLPILLETHHPLDVVIIMLGTNDSKSCYKASAHIIGSGIEKLIKQVKTYSANAKVLLISPVLLGDISKKPEYDKNSLDVSKKLKQVYYEISKKHNCHFLAAEEHVTANEIDPEHFDAKSHRKLADAILKKLKEI